jgi:hypothetical protein
MGDTTQANFAAWTRTIATGNKEFGLLSFCLTQFRANGPIIVTLSGAATQLRVAKNTLRDRIEGVKPGGIVSEKSAEILQKLKAFNAINNKAQSISLVTLVSVIKAMDGHLPPEVIQGLQLVASEPPPPSISINRMQHLKVPRLKGLPAASAGDAYEPEAEARKKTRVLPSPSTGTLNDMTALALRGMANTPHRTSSKSTRPSALLITRPPENTQQPGERRAHYIPQIGQAGRESLLRMGELANIGGVQATRKRTPFKVVGTAGALEACYFLFGDAHECSMRTQGLRTKTCGVQGLRLWSSLRKTDARSSSQGQSSSARELQR